mmetsp:Transcript_24682/g.52286  ORF Transcript_24682/g.52286 Transcript_24682/m.52286 type:complete len:314 (+) Transcript_24682:897-1838(+)
MLLRWIDPCTSHCVGPQVQDQRGVFVKDFGTFQCLATSNIVVVTVVVTIVVVATILHAVVAAIGIDMETNRHQRPVAPPRRVFLPPGRRHISPPRRHRQDHRCRSGRHGGENQEQGRPPSPPPGGGGQRPRVRRAGIGDPAPGRRLSARRPRHHTHRVRQGFLLPPRPQPLGGGARNGADAAQDRPGRGRTRRGLPKRQAGVPASRARILPAAAFPAVRERSRSRTTKPAAGAAHAPRNAGGRKGAQHRPGEGLAAGEGSLPAVAAGNRGAAGQKRGAPAKTRPRTTGSTRPHQIERRRIETDSVGGGQQCRY